MAGPLTIAELEQEYKNIQALRAQMQAAANTTQVAGPFLPVSQIPQRISYAPRHSMLSDFDIELMAACISNKHPIIEGQSHCFCTLKRLERGISKD